MISAVHIWMKLRSVKARTHITSIAKSPTPTTIVSI